MTIALVFFLSAASLGWLPASQGSGPQTEAREVLNEGLRLQKAGEYDTALSLCKRALQLDPDLLDARICLATNHAMQFIPGSPSGENKQMAEAAIQEFERVLARDPNNIIALRYIANLYYGLGGGYRALDDIRKYFEKSKEYRHRLIEVDPQNPEHYYAIGVLDWALAYRPRNELKERLGLRPDEPLARIDQEDLAEMNGDIVDEGIEMLRKALELNPKHLDAVAYLNLMYREKADIVADWLEREELLRKADDMLSLHKRLREEIQREQAIPQER